MSSDGMYVQNVNIDDIPRPMADAMFKDLYEQERAHSNYVDNRRNEIISIVTKDIMPSVLYTDEDGVSVLDYEALGRWYIGTALRFLSECDPDLPEDVADKVAMGDCDMSLNVIASGVAYGFCSMSLGHDEICELNENISDMNEALETCAQVIRSTGQSDRSPLVVMRDLRELRDFVEGEE